MIREFGATAWGRAWLRAIETILITGAPDRDLPRARTLARRAIDALTIDGPHITARLTERGHEHTITMTIPVWNREEQGTVARIIGQAETRLGGDLPDLLVTELTSAGVRIAPHVDDITATSDTGEASRRHVLAICYALVQRIDEEPHLAVSLRTTTEFSKPAEGTAGPDLMVLSDIDPRTFYGSVGR